MGAFVLIVILILVVLYFTVYGRYCSTWLPWDNLKKGGTINENTTILHKNNILSIPDFVPDGIKVSVNVNGPVLSITLPAELEGFDPIIFDIKKEVIYSGPDVRPANVYYNKSHNYIILVDKLNNQNSFALDGSYFNC